MQYACIKKSRSLKNLNNPIIQIELNIRSTVNLLPGTKIHIKKKQPSD